MDFMFFSEQIIAPLLGGRINDTKLCELFSTRLVNIALSVLYCCKIWILSVGFKIYMQIKSRCESGLKNLLVMHDKSIHSCASLILFLDHWNE